MAKRPSDPDEKTGDVTEDGRRDLPLVALRDGHLPRDDRPAPGRPREERQCAQRRGRRRRTHRPRHPAPGRAGGDQRSSELYGIGTLAKIAQVVQLQDGTVRAIVQGQSRLRLHSFTQSDPYLRASIEELPDEFPDGLEVQALMRTVQAQIEQYVANGAPVSPEAAVAARNITEPGLLADMVAYSPDMSTEQRQELLETIDVTERLKLVSNFLANQVEILELKGRIQSEVKSEMDKTQREYILREQLKAIQRELVRTTRSRPRSTSFARRSRPPACRRRSRPGRSRRSTG